ncbi:MAG: RidA family protein [Candidatus Binatia bacterium]
MEIIDTPTAPQPKAPIAQAVRSGNLLFVSGTTPFTVDFTLAKGDFGAVILANREDESKMNGIYAEYFPPGRYPARTAFQAPLPHPDFLVEVESVAEIGASVRD